LTREAADPLDERLIWQRITDEEMTMRDCPEA